MIYLWRIRIGGIISGFLYLLKLYSNFRKRFDNYSNEDILKYIKLVDGKYLFNILMINVRIFNKKI